MTTVKNKIGERIVTGLSASFIAAGFVVGGVKNAAVEIHHPALSIYARDVRIPTTARWILVRELRRKNTLALAASWAQQLATREKRRPVYEPRNEAQCGAGISGVVSSSSAWSGSSSPNRSSFAFSRLAATADWSSSLQISNSTKLVAPPITVSRVHNAL